MFLVLMRLRGEQWIRYTDELFRSVYDAMCYIGANPCRVETKIVHKHFEHLYTEDYDIETALTNKRGDIGDIA